MKFIIYVCNLCNKIVQFVIKNDKEANIKFASLHSEFGQNLLKKYNLPTHDLDTVVFVKNNKAFIKSSAILEILKAFKFPWNLTYVFIILPKFFRDFIYNKIANSRYRVFGKSDSCMIPNPDYKSRFLD